jgi:hypothetical protein
MKIQRSFVIGSISLLLPFFLLFNYVGAQAQSPKSTKYACSEPNPAALCNASNTCGSPSTPCTVDVKRTASSAEAVPSIAKPKGNAYGLRRGLRPFRSLCTRRNHHRWFRPHRPNRGEEGRVLQVFRGSLCVGRHLRDVRECKCRACRRRCRQLASCIVHPGRTVGQFGMRSITINIRETLIKYETSIGEPTGTLSALAA